MSASPNKTQSEQIHLLVAGKVQGVGFRHATLSQAKALGIRGWVRNTEDARVEVLAEGSPAQIEEFVSWCRRGSPSAQVTAVEIRSRGPTPPDHPTRYDKFEILR
jgi:acylphosphatase